MEYRPCLKVLDYGHTGARKSSLAKTFPKPMLVWMFDAHGKDFPYWRDNWHRVLPPGSVGELQEYQVQGTEVRVLFRDIQHPDGLVRVEYYHDLNPERPTAFSNWRLRRSVFHQEFNVWKTVVTDSLTSLELAARLNHKYFLNPQTDKDYKSRDPRKWFGGSTDDLEEALKVSFLSYPMNVVVTAHVDLERDESAVAGLTVRNPMAPGRLRGSLAQQYMELWYSYVHTDVKTGQTVGLIQTQPNGIYNAASQIDVPNPCYAHYESIWVNYDLQRA
jgi:hypothetical protein